MLTIPADGCAQHLNKLTIKQRLLKTTPMESFSLAQMEKCHMKEFRITCLELVSLIMTQVYRLHSLLNITELSSLKQD